MCFWFRLSDGGPLFKVLMLWGRVEVLGIRDAWPALARDGVLPSLDECSAMLNERSLLCQVMDAARTAQTAPISNARLGGLAAKVPRHDIRPRLRKW